MQNTSEYCILGTNKNLEKIFFTDKFENPLYFVNKISEKKYSNPLSATEKGILSDYF